LAHGEARPHPLALRASPWGRGPGSAPAERMECKPD
jgi:hypothetical protein